MSVLHRSVDLAAAARPGAGLTPLGASSYALQGGLEVHVVSRHEDLSEALRRLRRTAAFSGSPAIAIDVEWRPDLQPGSNNPVALVQLAAGNVCVLVRTCLLGLPQELRSFLRWAAAECSAAERYCRVVCTHHDLRQEGVLVQGRVAPPRGCCTIQGRAPGVCSTVCSSSLFLLPCSDQALVFVGLNWQTADERKMASSFGWETRHFGRFEDLGSIASRTIYGLGARPGLAALAERVLVVMVPKNKSVRAGGVAAGCGVLGHQGLPEPTQPTTCNTALQP